MARKNSPGGEYESENSLGIIGRPLIAKEEERAPWRSLRSFLFMGRSVGVIDFVSWGSGVMGGGRGRVPVCCPFKEGSTRNASLV